MSIFDDEQHRAGGRFQCFHIKYTIILFHFHVQQRGVLFATRIEQTRQEKRILFGINWIEFVLQWKQCCVFNHIKLRWRGPKIRFYYRINISQWRLTFHSVVYIVFGRQDKNVSCACAECVQTLNWSWYHFCQCSADVGAFTQNSPCSTFLEASKFKR